MVLTEKILNHKERRGTNYSLLRITHCIGDTQTYKYTIFRLDLCLLDLRRDPVQVTESLRCQLAATIGILLYQLKGLQGLQDLAGH